jgi:hypothetical protein
MTLGPGFGYFDKLPRCLIDLSDWWKIQEQGNIAEVKKKRGEEREEEEGQV